MTRPTSELSEQVDALEALQARLAQFFETVIQAQPFQEESLDAAAAARQLAQGHCLLSKGAKPDPAVAIQAAGQLADLLEEALPEQGDALQALRRLVEADPPGYLNLVLEDQGGELLARCRAAGVPEDLAVFHAVLLGRPFRGWHAQRLARFVTYENWNNGSCPICGHWPALSLIEDNGEGRRYLWCHHCGCDWRHHRLKCAFCGCDEPALLQHLHLEGEEGYRLEGCTRCKRYVKQLRTALKREDLPWDAIHLGTIALDMAAVDRGLMRESPLIGQRPRDAVHGVHVANPAHSTLHDTNRSNSRENNR